ncbi:MAG TPA: carbohydrate-binding protein [Verrucomicrobiae bacterium]
MASSTPPAAAANNPLAKIPGDRFNAKTDGIKLEACDEGGQDLCAIHNGDYVVYQNYDFDSGVAAFKARIATKNHGAIEIRLDNLKGPLLGKCDFDNTGGWQDWRDVSSEVDNSQAGVRDIYLIFRGNSTKSLVNLSSFIFLKSITTDTNPVTLAFPDRNDVVDGRPQATNAWGLPEAGFHNTVESVTDKINWKTDGMSLADDEKGNWILSSVGTNFATAYTPDAYINQTDTGGEWRSLAEASLSAEIIPGVTNARPSIGFTSSDLKRAVYVTLNPAANTIEVWRRLADDSLTKIKRFSWPAISSTKNAALRTGEKYRLQIDWSPYSNGMIVQLENEHGDQIANFRTVVDLPAARHPFVACSGGPARFSAVRFDPTLDSWNFRWEWRKTPVLTADVCNPAVWKWKDGNYYMMWRKFGQDTYHGIAVSTNGIAWRRLSDTVLKCTGDMNVLMNPFNDGLVYVTPGGKNMPWFASDGSSQFTIWKDTGLTVGNIFGNSRIQEIVDTKQYAQLSPINFAGQKYRFIAFTENWTDNPRPHTVVLLSNTLTNWVLADPNPVIPPRSDFWGEKGSAIGSAIPLPDGSILLASCSCTDAGYTGAPEPSNVSVIVDGRQPWKVLRLGILPDAPVSREKVWYQGPNFGTAFYYERGSDTLFYYGGFHDYTIGMMRVQNFSRSKLFMSNQAIR